MKKIIAAVIAISMILSLSACQNNPENSDENNSSDNVSSTESVGNTPANTLSNPVAVDENGEVDMKVALSYQTDTEALIKELEAQTPDGSKPVSKNTNPETLALFNYLKSIYGKQTLAGQQYFGAEQYEDILYYMETGDLPAVKGFDFIFSHGETDTINDKHIDDAIQWHTEQNGIVAFCWHWKVPVNIGDESILGRAFYTKEITDFSFENAVTPGTKEYEVVIKDIDTIALKLQRLEAAGVPVLFRPLHEASGNWFWWGVSDKDVFEKQLYQKLWYIVFDRLENYHKLTNLIWIWNGQAKKCSVNANTYDIGGMDIYPNKEDHSAQESQYDTLVKLMPESKMATISECGYIPDPNEIYTDGSNTKWLYFMPWNGEFVCETTSTGAIVTKLGGTPSINEKKMSSEFLKKVYASDKIITLSELPDFEGTVRKMPAYIKSWEMMNSDLKPDSKLSAYKQ